MNNRILSCVVALLISGELAFADNDAWAVSNKYKGKQYRESVVSNIARARSQDSIGICYSVVASVLLDSEYCRVNNVSNCKELPLNKSVSSLGMSRYGNKKDADVYIDERMKSMDLYGGSSYMAVNAAIRIGGAPSEECISLDKVLSKIGSSGEMEVAQERIWDKLKATYFDIKKTQCAECTSDVYSSANEINDDLNLKEPVDQSKLLSSFSKDSLDSALNSLLYPKECSDKLVPVDKKMKMVLFPDKASPLNAKGKIDGFNSYMAKIKSVVGGKPAHPMVVNFCGIDNPPAKPGCANGGHSVVIAGFREYCSDTSTKNCEYELKVVNSWGESWQQSKNDGWIDARSLLDRTYYDKNSMFWLED